MGEIWEGESGEEGVCRWVYNHVCRKVCVHGGGGDAR